MIFNHSLLVDYFIRISPSGVTWSPEDKCWLLMPGDGVILLKVIAPIFAYPPPPTHTPKNKKPNSAGGMWDWNRVVTAALAKANRLGLNCHACAHPFHRAFSSRSSHYLLFLEHRSLHIEGTDHIVSAPCFFLINLCIACIVLKTNWSSSVKGNRHRLED